MLDDTCAMVRQYLMQIVAEQSAAQPTPAICAHIAGCANCRGALALLLAEALGGIPAQPISCDMCQRDLAALIDAELLLGYAEAQVHYPLVWWHLWTCADCAETYELTHALVASDEHALPVYAAHQRARLCKLSHSELDDTVGQSPLAFDTRRGRDSELVYLIYNEPADEGSLLWLAVQRQANGSWLLDVRVQPAPAGSLIAMLGDQQFSARFDAGGCAVVRDIAFGLLVGEYGRDLDLLLERDAHEP